MMLRIPALYRILNAFEMQLHALDGQFLVPLLERLEDREMLLMIARAGAEDAEDEPLLFSEEILEHITKLRDHRVA